MLSLLFILRIRLFFFFLGRSSTDMLWWPMYDNLKIYDSATQIFTVMQIFVALSLIVSLIFHKIIVFVFTDQYFLIIIVFLWFIFFSFHIYKNGPSKHVSIYSPGCKDFSACSIYTSFLLHEKQCLPWYQHAEWLYQWHNRIFRTCHDTYKTAKNTKEKKYATQIWKMYLAPKEKF